MHHLRVCGLCLAVLWASAACGGNDATPGASGGLTNVPPCTAGTWRRPDNPCLTIVVTCDERGLAHFEEGFADDGATCDDGDACTEGERCQAGVCQNGTAVTCEARDACHQAGTCDPATGLCTESAVADGTACDDGDPCTEGDTCQGGTCRDGTPRACPAADQCNDAAVCDPATGQCANRPRPDGTPCDDGDACTRGDTCRAGACIAGEAPVCPASDQCHDAGTCDPATGECVVPARPDGTACDDANACTRTDSCVAGACVGADPVTCAASDQCHDVGTCDPATGACSNPVKADGASCSDGTLCTRTDTCQGGVCTGGAPVVCAAADQCHDAGTCDPATGACSNPARADGATCDDGNACTVADTCQAGACRAGTPTVCTASDQCHDAGTCDPATGQCSNPAKADGAPCSDGTLCTRTDTCQAGACTGGAPVVCAASDQCHDAGLCDPATGRCSNPARADGSSCDDGNACTQADTCQAGACRAGAPRTCTASDQCHEAGTCDPATGQCSNPVKADGAPCSDGTLCTRTDTCQAGTCTGGDPVTCVASDQCHDAGTCDPATGQCSNPARANGSACNDGNACTRADACLGGTCTGGDPVVCTAFDQCHEVGTCNPATGQCSNPAKADGAPCSDGTLCTRTDTCQGGACTGGNPVVCTASDQCHDAGTCDPGTGVCSNPARADGTGCNDGTACTRTDTCTAGVCTGADPAVCAASDQCHDVGTCDPSTGQCSNPARANGTACDDGDLCTRADTCQAGACAGVAVVCVASDQCHDVGTCDPVTGACSDPARADGTACDDGVACTTDACQGGSCTGTWLAGCPTRLAFLRGPRNSLVNEPVRPDVRVAVVDGYGTPVPGPAPAITVALGANPGGATLTGTLTLDPVVGVATFMSLVLDRVGRGYTLVASAAGLPPLTSAAFDASAWVPTGPSGGNVRTLTVDPTDSAIVFATTQFGRLYRTTNGGTSWTSVAAGGVANVVIDPAAHLTIYAGTSTGVVRSTDGGDTWTPLSSQYDVLGARLAISPSSPQTLYAMGYYLSKSTDGGVTFARSNISLPQPSSISFHPTDSNTVYGAFYGYVYKTTDGGATWRWLTSAPTYTSVVAVDPQEPLHVYVTGTSGSAWRSTDGGTTFTSIQTNLPRQTISAFAIAPGTPSVLYAAVFDGVWRSNDGGASWTGTGGVGSTPAIAVGPQAPSTVYLASPYLAVLRTTDAGGTWTEANSGIYGPEVTMLAAAAAEPDTAYATRIGYGLIRTTDGGGSWSPVAGWQNGASVFAIDAINASLLYGVNMGQLQRSTDAGATWAPLSWPPASTWVVSLLADPSATGALYAAVSGGTGGLNGLYRSADQGDTWTVVEGGLPSGVPVRLISSDPNRPEIRFASADRLLYRSSDSGVTWTSLGWPETNYVMGVAADPQDPDSLWALVASQTYSTNGAAYYSADRGATWTQPLSRPVGSSIFVDRSGTLFTLESPWIRATAVGEPGTWRVDLALGLSESVTSMVPGSDDSLWIGTRFGGSYRLIPQ